MSKVVIPPMGNPENSSFVTALNNAIDQVSEEFEKVVYRDGSFDFSGPLDMGSNRLYNLPAPVTDTEPLRLKDIVTVPPGLSSTFTVPEFYGAKGDGVTDDYSALATALLTGREVYLNPTKTYAFGSQLVPPSYGGFIGDGELLMLTGIGKFAFSDYTGSATAKAGILISDKTNVKIRAKISLQANAGIRTANAIWVQNSTNVELDVNIYNFKEMQAGAIEWNSNSGGWVKAFVHDIYSNASTGLASMQLTALSVDNNRVAGVNSRGLFFNVYAKNIVMGAAALTAFGYQTDGVNLQGATSGSTASAYAGHTGFVRAENVHEPIDIFSDYNNVTVAARDCLFGVKLIHGASRNVVKATIHNTMLHGVFISGTNTGGKTTSRNRVEAVVTGIGEFNPTAFGGGGVAALIDGAGATYGCDSNTINITYEGDGVNLDYGAAINGGTNNTIIYEGSGAVQETRDYTALSAGNVFKRRRPTLVRAFLSASTSYANDTSVVFNTEELDRCGEFNPATGVFTAKSNCTLRVKYSAAGASIAAGGNFGSYIRKGGSIISRKTDKNFGAGASDMAHEHSALVTVIPGDTIFIRTDTSASISHYGTATYLEIEEV